MNYSRRSLIISAAGVAAGSVPLVRAESSDLISIPYSVHAAKRWAVEQFSEMPQCRLVFSDGSAYCWFKYQTVTRNAHKPEVPTSYAVAIEVAVTDAEGRRGVHTIPVDGYGLHRTKHEREAERNATAARHRNEWLALRKSILDQFDF